jgi:hypothetical protein
MRESRTYGSVRGARGDARPYRDRYARNDIGGRPCVDLKRSCTIKCGAVGMPPWWRGRDDSESALTAAVHNS